MANSLAWINATWTPSQESTLLGWWKADSLALSNNDPVSSWNDSGTHGYTMTQTGANRPTYKTNIKNGLPSVLFDQASIQHMTSSMPSNSKPFTAAVVMYSASFQSHLNCVFGSTTDGDIFIYTTTETSIKLESQIVVQVFDALLTLNNGSWYIVIVTYDGSGNYTLVVNGVTIASGTNNKSFSGGGTTLMGARNGPLTPMDGYISEIMEFTSVVNTSIINTYLNERWAVY